MSPVLRIYQCLKGLVPLQLYSEKECFVNITNMKKKGTVTSETMKISLGLNAISIEDYVMGVVCPS